MATKVETIGSFMIGKVVAGTLNYSKETNGYRFVPEEKYKRKVETGLNGEKHPACGPRFELEKEKVVLYALNRLSKTQKIAVSEIKFRLASNDLDGLQTKASEVCALIEQSLKLNGSKKP